MAKTTALSERTRQWDITLLKRLLLVSLVTACLHFARTLLIPLVIAAMLSTLFLPFCKWLERRKIHRAFAVLLSLLTLLLTIGVIGYFFSWKVQELAGDFTMIRYKTSQFLEEIQYFLYDRFGLTLVQQVDLLKDQRPVAGQIIPVVAGSIIDLATQTILVGAYFFLLLYYRNHLYSFILMATNKPGREETELVIHQVAHVSQHYLLGLAKMIACLWLLYGIAFSALGLEDAIFFAVLCGLLEIIPYIGNLTGTLITVSVAAVHGGSPTLLAGIVVVYACVQFVQGWILEPLIVGPQVRINPLFTILALVVGHLIWGLAGIFLAIPLIAVFKIVCDHVEGLKPYGFLVGEIARGKSRLSFYERLISWAGKGKKHN